jgi:hypothetical protein
MPEPPAESMNWVKGAAKLRKLAIPVSAVVGITAVSGAFVAGNDAVCQLFLSVALLKTMLSLLLSCMPNYLL